MTNSLLIIASKQLRSCLSLKNSICLNAFRSVGNSYNHVKFAGLPNVVQQQTRWLRTSCCFAREFRKENKREVIQKPDEGTEGEKSIDLDSSVRLQTPMFPDENTSSLLFDGVRFDELNIVLIQVSKNNTIMTATDSKGKAIANRSCGLEGFKNTKKGTNIAAQATAITLGMRIIELGVRNVRVRIYGLGPGRMAAIKGLQMAGVNIVSITDSTPAEVNCSRPRKVRRL